jgi:hypothetical protein
MAGMANLFVILVMLMIVVMVRHGTSWYVMARHGTSWYVMSWYVVVRHGTWYICHGCGAAQVPFDSFRWDPLP